MIPLAAFLPYKWLALGLAFLALLGYAAWERDGRKDAEFALEQERRIAAEAVSAKLEANSRIEAQIRTLSQQADAQYLKGKRDADKAFQPIRDELVLMRRMWGMRNKDDSDSLSQPDPPSVNTPRACTDEPRRIIEAATRVVEDLKTCAEVASQLEACRAYAVGVKCSASSE